MVPVPTIRGNASEKLGLVDGETLSDPSPTVVSALQDFENKFANNVMGFTVEAEVRDYVRQRLSDHLERQVQIYGAPVEVGNDYKKPYARGIAQPVETDAVHAEANIGHSSDFESVLDEIDESSKVVEFDKDDNGGANRSLDIGVLKNEGIDHPVVAHADELAVEPQGTPEEAIEVAIAAGSKYFPPNAIKTAIELKYIKNKTTPGTIHENNVWAKVDSDFKKLKQMYKQLNEPPESHLVIVTNYDPFRMARHCDETGEEDRSRGEIRSGSSYPEKFKEFVAKCADINVHVWIYHPTKIYQDGSRV